MQFYNCMGARDRDEVEVRPTEHVETAGLVDQVEALAAAVDSGGAAPAGRLWGLPELGEGQCWVDIAGASVLARVQPRTITGWLSRGGPRRNPFPAPARYLYRLYWPEQAIRAWRATEDTALLDR